MVNIRVIYGEVRVIYGEVRVIYGEVRVIFFIFILNIIRNKYIIRIWTLNQ